jgi:hypothetical protein
MANIFTLDNIDDFSERLNIDDLYEKKREHDLRQLDLYNKLLNRIHVKIKTTSRQKLNEQFCSFVVPEIMIGVPKYDQGACIAYLMDKLKENGFNVRYVHPNLLWIAWNHWVPSYVRSEIKKKTGVVVDEYGQRVPDKNEHILMLDNKKQGNKQSMDPFSISRGEDEKKLKETKKFTPVDKYKPGGSLVYDEELFKSLKDPFS